MTSAAVLCFEISETAAITNLAYGQFIRNLFDDPLDDATVRCFVEVARVLGIQTVAEYVGNEEVMTKLVDIGVDFGQGFHIHKPEPLRT